MSQWLSLSNYPSQLNSSNQKQQFLKIVFQTLVVTAFISFILLFEGNVGSVNEVDILPFIRQHIDPNWIPNDFYLNEPAGYRLPFILLFGHLTTTLGFLATSIIGRLICYTGIAFGFLLLGQKLGLTLPFLLVSIGLFIYAGQGYVADEWAVRGFESKAVAYVFLFWAVALMLSGSYRLMAIMLGLASTFHVLVGGWISLAILGWLMLRRRKDFNSISYTVSVLVLFLISSAWAIWVVLQHLLETGNASLVSASYIYVFLRLPHHLNPLAWEWYKWGVLFFSLFLLGGSLAFLNSQQKYQEKSIYQARLALAELTFITLIPFLLGVAIAPFDTQGKLLQYYPFRVGSLMLGLTTSLLLICSLQTIFVYWKKRTFKLFCIFAISVILVIQALEFKEDLLALRNFPSEQQGVNAEWKEMSSWIRNSTPRNALIISPPVDLENFNWLTERATLAKYKQMPQTYAGIEMWYERMAALSGNADFWQSLQNLSNRNAKKHEIKEALSQGYNQLSTEEVKALLVKYKTKYLLTKSDHSLNLPISHANSGYILYSFLEK